MFLCTISIFFFPLLLFHKISGNFQTQILSQKILLQIKIQNCQVLPGKGSFIKSSFPPDDPLLFPLLLYFQVASHLFSA